eukprot:1156946-Pelagomonas_calceolata.AAC.3
MSPDVCVLCYAAPLPAGHCADTVHRPSDKRARHISLATVQPQSIDRQINTRHTGTTKSRHSHEVSVQFNLCSEPWLKYSLAAIADKGMHQSQLTSARLLHSVLYVETHR